MARTSARIGGRGHDVRERGVLAMVGGSEHHPLYANPRQYPQKEQPVLRPGAVHVSTREQQLPLSCRRATELRRLERSQSCPCLYRQCQTLRSMPSKSRMHEWTI